MEDELYYLREGFEYNKLKKLDLVSIINRHSGDEKQVSMALTKTELINEYELRVQSKRAIILEEISAVIPTGANIEDVETRGRPSRKSKNALDSVHLSPAAPGPRTRSRSRSPVRVSASPAKRRTRREALKEAIVENPELEEQVTTTTTTSSKSSAKSSAKSEKVSPTKAKKVRSDPTAQLLLSQSPDKKEKELLKSPTKSRKSKTVKKVKEAIKEEESNFSSENLFQEPSSTDFKRKRRADPEDAAEERPAARRREVAPHKHKQEPPQSLPENAQDVFSHPPDLQAPANLSHEPFDVSYGEPNDATENFIDQALQLPDADEVAELLTSTPAHTAGSSFLPSFAQVQNKVSSAVGAVENVARTAEAFAKEIDGFNRSSSEALSEEEVKTEVKDAEEEEEEKVEEPEDHKPWYKFNVRVPRPHLPEIHKPNIPKPNIPKPTLPTLPTIAWKKITVNTLKYSSIFVGSVITLAVILFGSYLLYWVRAQKLAVGYCIAAPQPPVTYPAFLEVDLDDYHPIIQDIQGHAFTLFERCAPSCTKCPENAKCTLYEAHCTETYVQQWPILSYFGVPLAPHCCKDPVKLFKLKELKKRAVSVLNQQKADHECIGTESAALSEADLRAQLSERKMQGVDEELFEELFEKVRVDFLEGEVEYPEITVTRQVTIPKFVDETLTMTADPEPEETLFFESSSLSHISFGCRLKLATRKYTQEHREELRRIICFLFIAVGALALIGFQYIRHSRRQGVYDTWIKVLQELREDADNDSTGQQTGWSAAHILLRQAEKQDRDFLEKKIEANPSVRVREVEQAGEMVRAWEWAP